MSPQPPLTALELLDCFQIDIANPILAQLKIDVSDSLERRALDKNAVRRWKRALQEQPWD